MLHAGNSLPLKGIFLLASLCLTFAHSARAEEDGLAENEENKSIAVGSIDILELGFQPRGVIVGKPDILRADQGSTLQQVRITPLKKGSTSVIIEDSKGKVAKKINYSISTDNLSQKVIDLRRLLQDIEGITIESIGDKIVIDGELIVPRDFDRILNVQSAYQNEVMNLVTLSKISREAIARRMQKEINDDPGGANVQVKIINNTFFLLGKVDSSADKERAETIAATYLPELQSSPAYKDTLIPAIKTVAVRNLIIVEEPPGDPPPKMVRITYHFVEIGKEFLKNSFFKWVPLLQQGAGIQFGQSTTGGVGASGNGSFSGIITNLLPKLQSGSNGGFARILYSTVNIGENNTQIELAREDYIPYISAIVNGVPIPANTKVGINIKVTPQIMGDEKLRLSNTFQFQAFRGATTAGSAPAVTSTNVNNTVILKSGESAALGGLVSNDTAKDIDKDPEQQGQASGDALFTLLRSKAFRNKKTQFVVFITPKIITDAAEGTADIKAKIINNGRKRRRVVR